MKQTKKVLVIDRGNTRLKMGWFEDGKLVRTAVEDEESASKRVRESQGMTIAYAGVKPLGETLKSALGQYRGRVVEITARTKMPLVNGYRAETLGVDRLLVSVAAWTLNPNGDSMVIDLGTAMTVEYIGKEGVYKGGNIAPGMRMRFAALHEHTARLPRVEPPVETDYREKWWGTDTEDAIRKGVVDGMRLEIEGYVERFGRMNSGGRIFLTGGDGFYFENRIEKRIFANPDMSLIGLNALVEE